jgi:hypothetical protein
MPDPACGGKSNIFKSGGRRFGALKRLGEWAPQNLTLLKAEAIRAR